MALWSQDYQKPKTCHLYSFEWGKCNTQYGRSIERSPAFCAKEPIPNRLSHCITAAAVRSPGCVLRHALSACALFGKLFLMLFEQNKQLLWDSCQISLVISNMKFSLKLGEQFWRILCFPIQRERSCTCMPERCFKDGRRVTWLALKGLWWS